MGYSTDFTGHFSVTPTLTNAHAAYLIAFSETRHMIRDEKVCASLLDPVREAVGLPIARDARFFVGEDVAGSVLAYSNEPEGVPGLWCQWVPTEDGTGIEWDQGEKFYEYEAWLTYLIEKFLVRWGYEINGTVQYQGEDPEDFGVLVIENNTLKVHEGVRTIPGFLEAPPERTGRDANETNECNECDNPACTVKGWHNPKGLVQNTVHLLYRIPRIKERGYQMGLVGAYSTRERLQQEIEHQKMVDVQDLEFWKLIGESTEWDYITHEAEIDL